MKTFEKLSYYISIIFVTWLAFCWFNDNQYLEKKLRELNKNEDLPLQVKILEPNVRSVCFQGFEGDIWWLEGSPFSETDFVFIDSEGFKKYITGGNVILKVPPKAVAYVLRGKIPDEQFTVDYYFDSPKSNPDTIPELESY